MDETSLARPQVRQELLLYLAELAEDDPQAIWRAERERGLSSGIDEVFHFFFDDHDFDEAAVGDVLLDRSEVAAVGAVKHALDAVLISVGDRSDGAFIRHPLWPNVTRAAQSARAQLIGPN